MYVPLLTFAAPFPAAFAGEDVWELMIYPFYRQGRWGRSVFRAARPHRACEANSYAETGLKVAQNGHTMGSPESALRCSSVMNFLFTATS